MTGHAAGPTGRQRAATTLFWIAAALLTAGAVAAACGGSASESPWPVEPDHLVVDPEGEDGRTPSRKDKDAHPEPSSTAPDAGPNVEP